MKTYLPQRRNAKLQKSLHRTHNEHGLAEPVHKTFTLLMSTVWWIFVFHCYDCEAWPVFFVFPSQRLPLPLVLPSTQCLCLPSYFVTHFVALSISLHFAGRRTTNFPPFSQPTVIYQSRSRSRSRKPQARNSPHSASKETGFTLLRIAMQHKCSSLVLFTLFSLLLPACSAGDNGTCLPALEDLPVPLSPGSKFQDGNYIRPQRGITILGDKCMVFCGDTTNTQVSTLATPHPALRPTSSITVTKEVTVAKSTSTSSTSTRPRSTATLHETKVVNPSYTYYVVGDAKTSTKWVVGGAHPTTLPPGASPTFPVRKREPEPERAPPLIIPDDLAAVSIPKGVCVTICPNGVLSGVVAPTATTNVTVDTFGVDKGEGIKKLPPAFIALAIVLPILSTLVALVIGAMMLKQRRTIKVLRNERNKGIEMVPEGFFRTQKWACNFLEISKGKACVFG